MRTQTLLLMSLTVLGCSENDLGDLKDISNPSDMDIEVTPAALDFGIIDKILEKREIPDIKPED